MMAVVSVSLFLLGFLCLWSLYVGTTSAEKLLCLLCKTISKVSYLIIILWISLGKGECFDFNHFLRCVYPTIYISRLLSRVYHFSLLICYPCSSSWKLWVHLLSLKMLVPKTWTKWIRTKKTWWRNSSYKGIREDKTKKKRIFKLHIDKCTLQKIPGTWQIYRKHERN